MREKYTVWIDEASDFTPEHYEAFKGLTVAHGIPVDRLQRRDGKLVGCVDEIWHIFGDLAEDAKPRPE